MLEAVLALAPENLLASRALVDICEREAAAALTDVPAARAAEAVLAEKTAERPSVAPEVALGVAPEESLEFVSDVGAEVASEVSSEPFESEVDSVQHRSVLEPVTMCEGMHETSGSGSLDPAQERAPAVPEPRPVLRHEAPPLSHEAIALARLDEWLRLLFEDRTLRHEREA